MGIRETCPPACHHLSLLLTVLVSLLWPLDSRANEFREGLGAYLDGDYETAQTLWAPLAEKGHRAAQHSLGTPLPDA